MQKILAILSLVIIMLLGMRFIESSSFREHRARAFAHAAGDGQVWKMRLLRCAGEDPGEPAPGTERALIWAASEGRFNSVQYLLGLRVDINQRNKFGYTPLIEAAESGQLSIVRYLLDQGADPNIASEDGSALHLALQKHRDDVVQLLKLRGAQDLNSGHATPIAKSLRK